MTERENNVRYYLTSKELGSEPITEVLDFDNIGGDVFKLEEGGHFTSSRRGKVELMEDGYFYLLSVILRFGPTPVVRLVKEVKDDSNLRQDWKQVSAPTIDLLSLNFKEENDNKSVDCDLVEDGELQIIKSAFSDEFDVVGEDAPPLPYVNIRLNPRQILRRSRLFVEDGVFTSATVSGGDLLNARAVPWKIDFNGDPADIQETGIDKLNAANDEYDNINSPERVFAIPYLNADTDTELTLNGRVEITLDNKEPGDYFTMDIVKYDGGVALNFKEKTQLLNMDPEGDNYVYEFVDYKIQVLAGESVVFPAFLSDTSDGISWFYTDTYLEVTEEQLYPATYTKAVRPQDMFKHLARLASGNEEMQFITSLFASGQRHENKLIVHGTWLRNMPQVLNEGEDDERRLQANLSLEKLYKAFEILEPLRYDVVKFKGRVSFVVGAEKDIQQNFIGIRIGETRDAFSLIEVDSKERNVIGDNYYRTIRLGSEKSGSDYGDLNNVYSVCGHAEWQTINKTSKATYEKTTDVRTGAEDVEFQRQIQYKDNPDRDGDYDNDWFLIDCNKVGQEYHPKLWQSFYATRPTKVYSADTNFNWAFAPVELLRGHGYKINAALYENPTRYLEKPRGNCSLSLVTQRAGEEPIQANEPFPHALLDPPRVRLMALEFEFPINQEVIDMLIGDTNGVDNKFGLVEVLYNGEKTLCRLIEVDTSRRGKFKLIQARL